MSTSVKLSKLAREKEEARNIVNEVIKFGVSDSQLYDIMLGLAMNIEDNNAMKDIAHVLKKYITKINNEENTDNNNTNQVTEKSKIIIN